MSARCESGRIAIGVVLMTKISIKYLALNLALLSTVNMIAMSTASAQQSASEFYMGTIQDSIDTAALDIPTDIMREIQDIVLETADLHVIRTRPKLPHDYKPGQYEELVKKHNELLALLRPYVEDAQNSNHPNVFYVDIPNLTTEQQTQHLLQSYIKEYEAYDEVISNDDLLKLESAIREQRGIYAKLVEFETKNGDASKVSTDFKTLQTQMRILNRRRKHILSPYKKAYQKKHREKEFALEYLSREIGPSKPLTLAFLC